MAVLPEGLPLDVFSLTPTDEHVQDLVNRLEVRALGMYAPLLVLSPIFTSCSVPLDPASMASV